MPRSLLVVLPFSTLFLLTAAAPISLFEATVPAITARRIPPMSRNIALSIRRLPVIRNTAIPSITARIRVPSHPAGGGTVPAASPAGNDHTVLNTGHTPSHPSVHRHPVADLFGVGTFATQRSLELVSPLVWRAQLSGARWVREEFTATRLHNGTDKAYWWGPYDRTVNAERHAGLRVLGLLDYSNTWGYPDHGTMPHEDMPRLCADFARYAYDVAVHFRGRVQYWEIWNEPDISVYWHPTPSPDDYARLLDSASRAIKRANPRAQIVLGGTSGVDLDYVRQVASKTSAFDVVAVHPYREHPEQYLLTQVRALQTFGRPVWFTEIGWPAGNGCMSCIQPDSQASYLARFYALAAAADVRRVFWYDFRDDHHSNNPRELHFGLLYRDLSAKPSFAAYAFLASALRNSTFVSAPSLGTNGLYVLRFQHEGEPLIVLWNTGTVAQDVHLSWSGLTALAAGMQGETLQQLPIEHRALVLTVQPGGVPVFIVSHPFRYRIPVVPAFHPVIRRIRVHLPVVHHLVQHPKHPVVRPGSPAIRLPVPTTSQPTPRPAVKPTNVPTIQPMSRHPSPTVTIFDAASFKRILQTVTPTTEATSTPELPSPVASVTPSATPVPTPETTVPLPTATVSPMPSVLPTPQPSPSPP